MSSSTCLKVGLTGSIGMGKSAVCKQFQNLGFSVFDADSIVHQLYAKGGEGVAAIQSIVPESIKDDAVDRSLLSKLVLQNSSLLKSIENVIHPLVKKKRQLFYESSCQKGDFLIVYDIPLLYENKLDEEVDYVIVVTASENTQKERVLSRPGMTIEKFKG